MASKYTKEELQRRSDKAKELYAQGKFGGAQPGSGRPPIKRRAAQRVAEAAERASDDLIAAFRAGLDPSQPATVRVNTAREWITVERQERELSLKEEKSYDDMSAGELKKAIMAKFLRLEAGGQNFDHEAEAVEFVNEIEDGDDADA